MRERELGRRVDSKVYMGGGEKMTDLSTTDDFFGGDSSRFSGPFPLLTVLSGFCGSGPPSSHRWTHCNEPLGGGRGARSKVEKK